MRFQCGWRIPILMYHRVAETTAARPFCIPLHRFRQQMRALDALGFRVVSVEEILEGLEKGRILPRRSVAITFDDGYADTYHLAVPILEKHRFPATVFLVTDRMGALSDWDGEDAAGPLMKWDEAQSLARRGITLGSHTRTHASLPALSDADLRAELVGSRRILEERLGIPMLLFAYPYARTDQRCQAAVRAAGYRGACAGARQGYHAYCLDRIDVTRAPLPLFLALISRWGYAAFYFLSRARQSIRGPGSW